jgi:hypothetical protein
MYASFLTQYVTKPMYGHAFGLRVKTMLLAQCKLFYDYVKEFLITDYSKAFWIMLYWENSHIFRGILYWPGIRYVRAKIELVGDLDRRPSSRYFAPWIVHLLTRINELQYSTILSSTIESRSRVLWTINCEMKVVKCLMLDGAKKD